MMENMEMGWRKTEQSLHQMMSHLLESALYSDVTFTVGHEKKKFKAHKFVLIGRSELFEAKLQERGACDEDSKDGAVNRGLIYIPDANTDTFELFLKFLYTDDFDSGILVQQAMELLRLGLMYQVHSLVAKARQALSSKDPLVVLAQASTVVAPVQDLPVVVQGQLKFPVKISDKCQYRCQRCGMRYHTIPFRDKHESKCDGQGNGKRRNRKRKSTI